MSAKAPPLAPLKFAANVEPDAKLTRLAPVGELPLGGLTISPCSVEGEELLGLLPGTKTAAALKSTLNLLRSPACSAADGDP